MTRIGLIADIHVVPGREEDVYDHLEAVLDRLSGVDHLVIMGDMVGSGSTGTYQESSGRDRALLGQVVDRVEAASPPATYLLGNHDVVSLASEEVADIIDQEPFGRFDVGGEDAIVLDTSAPHVHGSRGEVTEGQLDFLAETLPELQDALLFTHHPIHYHNVEDNVWWDVYPERAFCGNKKEINHLIDQHGGVQAVFNAHLHEHDHTWFKGLDHVTVEPFSRKEPGDGPTGAHAVADIGDDGIAVTMRDLEDDIIEYEL
ncbi:MAG: hypothetical protein SVU88_03230 [Candidatus Nanohaloarchaea archaeon]|nr:hypothetical protein [Candidatus Nanohaloarchaea archaeon]